jgi:hypothetical protein
MSRTLLPRVGGIVLLLGAPSALAFTTYPVDPATTNERQVDPDQLSDKTSNGQSGGTTFGLPGGLRLQFSAPPSSNSTSSPFVTFPSTVFVPSENR